MALADSRLLTSDDETRLGGHSCQVCLRQCPVPGSAVSLLLHKNQVAPCRAEAAGLVSMWLSCLKTADVREHNAAGIASLNHTLPEGADDLRLQGLA